MKARLVILFFFIISPLSFSQPTNQETGEREKTYHVEHYKIDIKLDLHKKTVDGKVTMSIKSLVDKLDTIKVDAAGMKIKSVDEVVYNETDKPELAEGLEKIKFNYNGNEIAIIPNTGIIKNYPYKFQIEYSTTNPESGMYFISPDSLFPYKRYEVWTQGEGEDNHYWFPCYDYPNDKATVETYLTIDKQYITISNGVLADVKENKDGTRTWHWALDKPYTSYLVMAAAGNYDVIENKWDDIPVYTYVPPGEKDIAFKSFNKTADIIKFFSDYTGFKYPWHRMNQVVVQDFVVGGMENVGGIVYTDVSIYDDKATPDYNALGLVAHENAHQWWGDVVTCKNWAEIWLNEGFATYFDALYKEYALGKDEFDYQIYGNQVHSLSADSISRRPIYTTRGLTTNTYDKGACVLHMLRYVMGENDFKKGLNNYITKHQFQNVTTEDLINSLNEITRDPLADRKPLDFHWFFNEWIYKAGQPEYKVSYVYNDTVKQILYTVKQIQNIDFLNSVFNMPIKVDIITSTNHFTQTVYPDTSSHTYIFSVDSKPLCIDFNKGNKVLCKLYYSKPKEDWLYQLNNSEDAIDRITAIQGLKDFINDGTVIQVLVDKMKNDIFWGVREESTEMLANSENEKILNIFIEQYKNESDSRIRSAIMNGFGDFYKNCNECANKDSLVNIIMYLLSSETNYYPIAYAMTAISKIVDKDKIYDLLIPFEKMDSHNEIIRRNCLEGLIESKDERAVDVFIKYAVNARNNRLRGVALRGLEHYLNEQKVIDVLNRLISSHNPYAKNISINMLKKAGNPSSKPFLEDELKKTSNEDAKKTLMEAIDAIK